MRQELSRSEDCLSEQIPRLCLTSYTQILKSCSSDLSQSLKFCVAIQEAMSLVYNGFPGSSHGNSVFLTSRNEFELCGESC